MDGHERRQKKRKDHNVKKVEADEGFLAHTLGAKQEQFLQPPRVEVLGKS